MSPQPISRDQISAPFFEAAADRRLAIKRCRQCGEFRLPSTQQCPTCASIDLAWSDAAGTGTLVSWIVVHGKGAAEPSVVGIVELDEGPWLHAAIQTNDIEQLRVGGGMKVDFVTPEGGETLPVFSPR